MWSYDPALPTIKDVIRFLIGDTDENAKLMEDEAIQVMYLQAGSSIYGAASRSARILASRFSRMNSVWVDTVRIDYAARAQSYIELSLQLAGELGGSSGMGGAWVAGVSLGEMAAVAGDGDRPPESFFVGMHDDLFPVTAESIL
jgi:hypothetical protein